MPRKNKKFLKDIRRKMFPKKIMLFGIIFAFLFFYLLLTGGVRIILSNLEQKSYGKNMTPLEFEIRKLVRNHPIAQMAPYIAKYDRKTAAFLVSVAKKESNWGLSVPKLNGQDCYNYWGYRGSKDPLTWDGYSCFNSREEAIHVVGDRFKNLIENSKVDTPRKMVTVWKCGYDCSWDNQANVNDWVSDVDYYFKKFF